MQPWNISLTHGCVVWGEAWEMDIRRAFAAVGWTVTSMGPTGSSTHVEEDHLELASDSKEFAPAVLMEVLSQLGVHRVEYLADALEESGCAEPGILAHLRAAGPHVLGCWALDALLANR